MAVSEGILEYRDVAIDDLQAHIRAAGGKGQKARDGEATVGFVKFNRMNKLTNDKGDTYPTEFASPNFSVMLFLFLS
jgi:hypothetical protein